MVSHKAGLILPFIKDDKEILGTLLSYTLLSSFLSLVVPVGAQVLINSLAAGVLVNPLVVISLLVFLGLILFSVFQIAQIVIVEKIQQKIFADISIKLAKHIPKIKLHELKQKYAPSIANRFFEIMTLQKSFAKMFLHWPSAVLQICLGLILIWIYNIYLVIFSIIILLFIISIYFLGKGGIETSINESSEKYNVADWLEDLARCTFTFKTINSKKFINEKLDHLILNYLQARKKHFNIILSQYITYYIFYIIASVGILVIGGWLVIDHKLSIGQLVASELIIINILRSTEIIMNFIENYYDLIAGIEKINYVLKMKSEKNTGLLLQKDYIDIKCENLSFGYSSKKILNDINLQIKRGQKVSLIGKSGTGKTSLGYLLSGALEPNEGRILVNDININEYDILHLRSKISIIGSTNEIFKGTIRENIIISNPDCSIEELNDVINLVGLNDDLKSFTDGLNTKLVNEGVNISLGQRLRILMARAMVKKPYLMILDEAFLSIDEQTKNNIINTLFSSEFSILDISFDYDAISKSDYIYVIENKTIVEHGSPIELMSKPDGYFSKFFSISKREDNNGK